MGIPTFFRAIVKNDPSIIEDPENSKDIVYNHFYIDFNSIVYYCIADQAKQLGSLVNDIPIEQYETMLLGLILNYLKEIVRTINPQKTLYISMDGVPPMAKIIKQRSRRFKSIFEDSFLRSLEKKYKQTIPRNKWTSASISPGTVFMDRLSAEIMKSIQNKDYGPINVIFDSYKVPGEGEQKIIRAIRKMYDTEDSERSLVEESSIEDSTEDSRSLVFSPDADLIVLLLMLHKRGLYILRKKDKEDEEEKGGDVYLHMSIDKVKDMFLLNVLNFRNKDPKKILDDIVFLTYMCGNDFVTSFSFMKIKNGSLDLLESIYHKIDTEEYLINDGIINLSFFRKIVKSLAEASNGLMKKTLRTIHNVRKTAIKEVTLETERTNFSHCDFYNPNNPLFEKYNKFFDKINYYDESWNADYNKYFNLEDIDSVCQDYINSLQFCSNYYNHYITGSTKFSWYYYYKYRNSPTFLDLNEYLNRNDDTFIYNKMNEGLSRLIDEGPLRPFQLLSIILPRKYFFLLPRPLKEYLMSIVKEDKITLDIVQGTKYIYSEIIEEDPIIIYDFKDIYLRLSDRERRRNELKNS